MQFMGYHPPAFSQGVALRFQHDDSAIRLFLLQPAVIFVSLRVSGVNWTSQVAAFVLLSTCPISPSA